MANTPLAGYPTRISNKLFEICDHTGPKSYGNIGTSSGTGDLVKSSDFAWGAFEAVTVEPVGGGFYSNSGNFIVKLFYNSSGTTPAALFPAGGAFQQFVLQWFTTSAAFGTISTEVTNTTDLSAETVRIKLWGV